MLWRPRASLVRVFPGLTWTSRDPFNSSVLKFGHSSGLSWVWSGKKKKKRKQQLLLGVNVHSNFFTLLWRKGLWEYKWLLWEDFNTFIKIKQVFMNFLGIQIKSTLSYHAVLEIIAEVFSLVRHPIHCHNYYHFFFWQTL